MDTFYEVVGVLVSIGTNFSFILFAEGLGFVFGPTSGYYFQYKLVKETESLGSFSIDVCAILIFSNLLRILFW